jgi:hypothetical protein
MQRDEVDPLTYEETAAGGRILVTTKDAAALSAIHEFLRFQIEDPGYWRSEDVTTPWRRRLPAGSGPPAGEPRFWPPPRRDGEWAAAMSTSYDAIVIGTGCAAPLRALGCRHTVAVIGVGPSAAPP